MFKLSYSLNSAELLPIEDVCEKLARFGYSGVELSFQHGQFDPFTITDERTDELKRYFEKSPIKPVCISTATTKFLSSTPHEPSLINTGPDQREKRSSLIKRGIDLAKKIGIPTVTFQSGYLRDEHQDLSRQEVLTLLADEIKQLADYADGETELVLEPEPGMFIESIADAEELMERVGESRLGLHLDVGHVFCTEEDYIEAIRSGGKKAKYVHMADIRQGFNLKYTTVSLSECKALLSDNAPEPSATLYDIDGCDQYIFRYGARKIHLRDITQQNPLGALPAGVETLAIDASYIEKHASPDLKHEILAYLDSVSGVEYERVLKAFNAVATLRLGSDKSDAVIKNTVCNTVRGKVHYHDLFGNGEIDYAKTISALIESGYSGYCTVELYNHAAIWRDIAPKSSKFILSKAVNHFGWDASEFGHIDHRFVTAPYIRVADAQMTPQGSMALLYDLRLAQPNTSPLPNNALHTLEHCLLRLLPDLVPGFLGVGPMGCGTGLYITTAYPHQRDFMTQATTSALSLILDLNEVPYQSESLCGMKDAHDLAEAKTIAASVMSKL